MTKRLTQNDFISKARLVHSDKFNYKLAIYVRIHDKVEIMCNREDHRFFQTPYDHIHKKAGCPTCYCIPHTTDSFIEKCKELNGDRYLYDKFEYKGLHIKTTFICKKHGEFRTTPYIHLHRRSHCPKCNDSKGESIIRYWLDKWKIEYERQRMFDGCRNVGTNRMLKFDFYLPKQNLCIEYDGELHFHPSKRKDANKYLKSIQERDLIKNAFCEDSGIELLRIKFDQKLTIRETLKQCLE